MLGRDSRPCEELRYPLLACDGPAEGSDTGCRTRNQLTRKKEILDPEPASHDSLND